MTDLSVENSGQLSARFLFPPSFSGFQGHFPDKPVLPGMCIIQAVLVAIETARKRRPLLQRVVNTKFFSVALPDTALQLKCTETPSPDGSATIKATVDDQGRKVAHLQLSIHYEGAVPA